MKKITSKEWEIICSENPTNAELVWFLKKSNKNNEAANILLSKNPNISELRYIIHFSNNDLQKDSASLFLLEHKHSDYSNYDLSLIIKHSDKYREIAAFNLMYRHPTNEELLTIIKHTSFKEIAFEKLLKIGASNMDLIYLMEFTSFKDKAAEQLLKQAPEMGELRQVLKFSKLTDQAKEMMYRENQRFIDKTIRNYGY